MNLDFILQESVKIELYEDKSFIRRVISDIGKWSWNKVKKTLQNAFKYLIRFAKDKDIEKEVLSIINKMIGKQYRKLEDLTKVSLKEDVLYENKWWDEAKGNFYGAISFYPLLQAFIELDKVVKDAGGADMKYVLIYALIWASIVSGKVLLSRKKLDDVDDVGKAYRNLMGIK